MAKQFGNAFIPQQFVDLDRFETFVKLLKMDVTWPLFEA